MPCDDELAQRVRHSLARRKHVTERNMFGGIGFMLRGHLCCGVVMDTLILRIGPEEYEHALAQPHTRPMDLGGRPVKGMIYVDPPGIEDEPALSDWIAKGVAYASSLPAT